MPSKRISSRKSSKHNNNNNNKNNNNNNVINKKNNVAHYNSNTASLIFTLIIQSLIIYYLYNLESKDCNCIYDWRHNYIKYFAIVLIIINTFNFTVVNMNKNLMIIGVLLILLQIINIYAFFTYIDDLNTTKCKCAIDKQPLLNKFMNILRWIQVIIFVVVVIMIIWFLLFMRNTFIKLMDK